MSRDRPIVPALGFERLTRFYDPVVAVTTRERTFKERLLAQVELRPGNRLLDLGCGTGTLTIEAKRRFPEATVIGVDADPVMLARARAKAAEAEADITFDEAFAQELPYDDSAFDAVISSLFFHHLDLRTKEKTAAEIRRVLCPGGNLHVADWGTPSDPLMAVLFVGVRVLDGFDPTRDNVDGRLPVIFQDAGFEKVDERSCLRTLFGTMRLYSARRQ